jgi:hypothetical protein
MILKKEIMMKLFYVLLALLCFSKPVYSHEMVPTYPKFEPSFMDGLYKTTMTMFNKRADVEYYEIGVFDDEWEPIPFVSKYKVYKIPYLSTVTFDIYVQSQDSKRVEYVCSKSKIKVADITRTAIKSRICSRVK